MFDLTTGKPTSPPLCHAESAWRGRSSSHQFPLGLNAAAVALKMATWIVWLALVTIAFFWSLVLRSMTSRLSGERGVQVQLVRAAAVVGGIHGQSDWKGFAESSTTSSIGPGAAPNLSVSLVGGAPAVRALVVGLMSRFGGCGLPSSVSMSWFELDIAPEASATAGLLRGWHRAAGDLALRMSRA